VIRLKNINRIYDTDGSSVRALSEVSLEIQEGEYIAIIGPSGSGKSTLMHILGCLDRPSSGSYTFYGREVTEFSDVQLALLRNSRIGFVFQQFHLLPRATVLENIMLPLVYAGLPPDSDKAEQILKQVGMEKRLKHFPNQLSGGEQQRVAIARALMNDPLVIFADEPTGNLDSHAKEEVMSTLEMLNKSGKTLIMVTHELFLAERADRIIKMLDGRIVADEKKKITTRLAMVNPSMEIDNVSCKKGSRLRMADHIKQAFRSMLTHKVRAFLSLLGILIGVAAVTAMAAVIGGARGAIQRDIASMGSNLLVVRPGTRQLFGVALERGAATSLTLEDADAIRQLPSVAKVSASVFGSVQAVWSGKNRSTRAQGVELDYEKMRASTPDFGRFFNEMEMKKRARVTVIGTTVAKELFEGKDPVGQYMRLNRIPFLVIGVLPEKSGPGWQDVNDIVLVPLSTAMYRLLGKTKLDSIDVEVKAAELIPRVQEEIKGLFANKYFARNPDEIINIRDMTEIQDTISKTTRTMSILLGVVSAVSLLVGGIGIMNIMLVSVVERTQEIGLRKAIGAKQSDILLQFLVESVILTTTGGIIGLGGGIAAAYLITRIAGWPVLFSFWSAIIAVLFSSIIGILFGVWPARRASLLEPITALRYE